MTMVAEQPIRQAASFRDPGGFVFELDGRVFRAIGGPCLDSIQSLHTSGLLRQLIDDGLVVPSEQVDDPEMLHVLHETYPQAAGFLEHRRIETITYPYEWSVSMLVDAGILTLDLQMRLLEHGLSLKDATAYNIQFDNGRPVFIDLPSIERPPRLDVWIALGQFNRMFTVPLLLNERKGQSLRSYFLADLDGRNLSDVRRAFGRLEMLSPALLLDVSVPYWLERWSGSRTHTAPRRIQPASTRPEAQLFNLRRLRHKLQGFAVRYRPQGHWARYTDNCSYSQTSQQSKMEAVRRFLDDRMPETVLDIGSNTGRYAALAAGCGAKVIAIDSDPDSIELLYRRVKQGAPSILPMCVDIANPSPGIGYRNRERAGFLDRVQADGVLALALIHHLHVTCNLPLEHIRDLLADLTRRYLVLEFVPPADAMFQELTEFRTDLFEDFTLERCLEVFGGRFRLIGREPITDCLRTLLFFEKTR